MSRSKIFIVIPSFNEEKHIRKIIREALSSGLPIILVDDGSTDSTYKIASRMAVRTIKHKTNLGKGAALKTGCEAAFAAGADGVIMMDSDGQHRIEDLDNFLKALDRSYDVVFGSRNLSYGVPLIRYLGNKIASVLVSVLFNIYVSDIPCGYRAITKSAYRKIIWESTGYGVETEMVINVGMAKLKHCDVPVETLYLDGVKGVTLMDALNVFGDVIRWRITK